MKPMPRTTIKNASTEPSRSVIGSKQHNNILFFIIFCCFVVFFNFTMINMITSKCNRGDFQEDDDSYIEPNEPKVLHWNSTERLNRPTAYTCHPNDRNGMKEIKNLMRSVLPEYEWKDLNIKFQRGMRRMPDEYLQENYTNEYDVFLGIFWGNCHSIVERWLRTHFNGRSVYFSGETEDLHPIMGKDTWRIHSFGPTTLVHERDLPLTYLQMTWWQYFQEVLSPSKMITIEERPRSNMTHYMIYANSNCVKYREEAIGLLSQFGIVHCDGKCQGTTPPSGNRTNLVRTKSGVNVENWWYNVQKYSNYRFCFVMEHTGNHPMYMTEKILMAFAAGCIPVYYGHQNIFHIFNKDSFVFYNISNPQPALDLVQNLETQKELYDEMMRQPILSNGENTISEYFSFSDEVGNGYLKQLMRKKLNLANLVP